MHSFHDAGQGIAFNLKSVQWIPSFTASRFEGHGVEDDRNPGQFSMPLLPLT